MSIPNEWKTMSIFDAVQIVCGQHIPANKYSKLSGRYPYLTGPSDFSEGKINISKWVDAPKVLCKAGDILLTVKGSGVGKLVLADKEYCISRQLMALRPKSGHPQFYIYLLSQLTDTLNKQASGTIPGITKDELENHQINLPTLLEQKKIAKIIFTWDEAICKLQKLIKYKTTVYEHLVNILIFEQSDPKKLANKSNWPIVFISEIAEEITEKNILSHHYDVLSCTKHKGFVRSLDFFGKRVFSDNLSGYKLIRRGMFGYPSNHLEEGSIGYQNLTDNGLVSPIYTVFNIDESKINPHYLFIILKTNIFKQIYQSLTKASVDRRGSLRWKDFSKIKIPLPSLEEQRGIVDIIQNQNLEIYFLKKLLKLIQKQKQGVIKQLLTGKVRTTT